MIVLPQLHAGILEAFPNPQRALSQPNGLLAFGGDLSPDRLLDAYRHGIFPWFNEGEPILWWSPDPRCVFRTDAPHVSRSTRRSLASCGWTVTVDRAFDRVIRGCAGERAKERGTWISPAMMQAYETLHHRGDAHSVEIWNGTNLVGGIYGVATGKLFCGESMFSAVSGGSKAALIALCALLAERGYPLLDAQVTNPHLISMGAVEIARDDFLAQVAALTAMHVPSGNWQDATTTFLP
ncbi:leucyl/phenylalanyl-tRNA--protein transferase [Rhodanobacter sp. A1T4]|uniref:leucyl/phenylalanyl-tRNA--protein transferase n=1 Tax=Rhodanobacter sp. A1T4 TaxID=2723087 RepID=UPI00161B473C|nr:leucyl/phenylalanyl-tRNA--protein transferase [Rhodanobacter sp. A1T4]MBB6246446.1 leucyl/phenylalanyl-tRNA--protein transferase [Rhodanobacter sp. A1T4]